MMDGSRPVVSVDSPELDYSRYTLLAVDDNAVNLRVAIDYLRGKGFRMLMARDGETGFQRAVSGQPDLILLDVVMPGVDGFETCRRLRADERTQEIPIIFMTALAEIEHRIKGFEVGGDDYVTKPLQHAELLARISAHLRIYDAVRKLRLRNEQVQRVKAAETPPAVATAHEPLDYRKYTILVVDDLATNLRVLTDYLRDLGFRILMARDGQTGFERAVNGQPDLILLDVLMPPGIDGFETCRLLKAEERTRAIPIIFMTALTEIEQRIQGFEAGGDDYITKPVQQSDVLSRINVHLRMRELNKTLQTRT